MNSLIIAAHEIGANCIIGLNVDMNEMSGKGKSMFMPTAIGTAVIIDDTASKKTTIDFSEKFENVDVDRINILQRKREIINSATSGTLNLDDENWDFITANQISKVYTFIINQLGRYIVSDLSYIPDEFYKKTVVFIDALPEETKSHLIHYWRRNYSLHIKSGVSAPAGILSKYLKN